MARPGRKKEKLEPKQELFCAEYVVDLNATQAAIRAGYPPAGAHVAASRLLKLAKVQHEIERRRQRIMKKLDITAEAVIRELALIGFANAADYMRKTSGGDPVIDLPIENRDHMAAIGEVTVEDFTEGRGEDARDVRRVKFKMLDKKGALVDLGRHLGIFEADNKQSGEIKMVISEADSKL